MSLSPKYLDEGVPLCVAGCTSKRGLLNIYAKNGFKKFPNHFSFSSNSLRRLHQHSRGLQ